MPSLKDNSAPTNVVQLISQDEDLVFVPPGEYELAFAGYETKHIFRTAKLYMHFRIVTPGPYFGKKLSRYYGVNIIGKAKRNGRFSAGWHSDLMIEYVNLFGVRPKKKSEIPITPYKQSLIVGRVATVKQNRSQKPYPELLHHSKIAELIRVAT